MCDERIGLSLKMPKVSTTPPSKKILWKAFFLWIQVPDFHKKKQFFMILVQILGISISLSSKQR